MVLVKPSSKLDHVQEIINTRIFKHWIKALSENRPTKRRIYIPKFQLEQTFLGLTEILKRMGVEDLFIPGKADLSGINGKKNLYCSAVVHKAFIKVDEEGTIAAAATGIGIKATSFTPSFVIDRPFLFYIIDRRYNVIMFSGKVTNPKVSNSTILSGDIRPVFNSEFTLFTSWITLVYPILTFLLLL